MKKGLFALAVTGICGAATAAEFGFSPELLRSTGSSADSVSIGDVNGDGRDDVVVTTSFYFDEENDYSVLVYLQRHDASLSVPQKYRYTGFTNSSMTSLIDLDSDGNKEIVVGHQGGLTILMHAGAEGFTMTAVPVEHDCTNTVVVDVDLDGWKDIVCQSWSRGATILHGDGKSGLTRPTFFETGARGYNDLKAGDITGDGLPDLVLVSVQSNHMFVYPHNGVDGFKAELSFPSPGGGWGNSAVAIGDFNNDGRNDIALTTGGNVPQSAVWLYSQTRSGELEAPVRMNSHDIPEALISTDLNKDGKVDLLVGHRGWAAVGRYMQRQASLQPELLSGSVFDGSSNALAVGDLNSDGCTDFAATGFSSLGIAYGLNCHPAHLRYDFDGDGRSDLFWRHRLSGANALWRSANYRTQQSVTRVTDPAWVVSGIGDFNGDGRADLLWHNRSTGANVLWKSANYRDQVPVTRINDLAWKVQAVADFNGDGRDDILWRHDTTGRTAIWRSGNSSTQQPITGISDLKWRIVAADDFDGDGRADVLWRNATTGANTLWLGGNFRDRQNLTSVTNQDWAVAGTGDFNGDRKADILWRNARSGDNVIWLAGRYSAQQKVLRLPGSLWKAVVADYDGDGKADIVWHHGATGENFIWKAGNANSLLEVTDINDNAWEVSP